MALVCSSSNTDHRIYGPSYGCQYPTRGEQAECKSRLLAKIHAVYCKALERLSAVGKARRPRHHVAARVVLHGGALCFGLLDPVSNIIANTVFFTPHDNNGVVVGGEAAELMAKDLERRSMDGLVTFLTRFFPYLADCEAVRYLLVADADALVAARLVVRDRRMARFGSSDRAVAEALEMALKCAALAAGHPDPDRLVGAWLAVSARLDDAVALLANVRRRRPASSSSLRRKLLLFVGDGRRRRSNSKNLWRPWQLAASRRPPRPRRRVPHQSISTTPLKSVLLDAIHGFYLAALARLPAGELRRRLHRSLLAAGSCYGPLDDPVSNIVVNAVWHDAAFPPRAHELEMDMVSTLSLHRVGTRSMYGLVSFLCTRYHSLGFHRAMRLLVESDANLLLADPNLDGAEAAANLRKEERRRSSNSPWSVAMASSSSRNNALFGGGPATCVEEAFKAAAIAAQHPNPEAQAKLLASCKQLLGPSLSPLLRSGGGQLTSADVQRLAVLLCPEPPSIEQPLVPFPLKEYVRAHTRIVDKVVAALTACAPAYQLHVVCGVNENVSGPVYCLGGSRFAPHKCYRCHVNFLASPKKGDAGDRAPVLFFAELSNDDDDDGGATGTLPLCCRVSAPPPCAERVRCLYCDYVGIRIVHPIGTSFHGREMEFEKMVCGEDPNDDDFNPALMQLYYTNTDIIRHSRLVADGIYSLKEDCLYDDQKSDDEDEGDQDVVYGDDYDIYE